MSNRSQTGEIKLTFQSTITNTLDSGVPTSANIQRNLITGKIDGGIDADEANRAWCSESRSLGSGGNETLDLYEMTGIDIGAGAGNDGLGQACLFEEIVALIVICEESSAGSLEIVPGTANPLNAVGSHTVASGGALNAGGIFARIEMGAAGINLGAGTKNVKFTANGGAVVYSVYVLGRHDDDESSSSSSSSTSSLSSSSSSSTSSTSTSSRSSSSSSLSSSSSS